VSSTAASDLTTAPARVSWREQRVDRSSIARSSTMKTAAVTVAIILWTMSILAGLVHADEAPIELVPVLKINKDLDERTAVKPSTIPGAGNGLFRQGRNPEKRGDR